MAEDVSTKAFGTDLIRDLSVPLEMIDNLIFLAKKCADNPNEVQRYLDMTEEPLKRVRAAYSRAALD